MHRNAHGSSSSLPVVPASSSRTREAGRDLCSAFTPDAKATRRQRRESSYKVRSRGRGQVYNSFSGRRTDRELAIRGTDPGRLAQRRVAVSNRAAPCHLPRAQPGLTAGARTAAGHRRGREAVDLRARPAAIPRIAVPEPVARCVVDRRKGEVRSASRGHDILGHERLRPREVHEPNEWNHNPRQRLPQSGHMRRVRLLRTSRPPSAPPRRRLCRGRVVPHR